jgi:tetratricopeptide (TPR) repeat protein
MRLATFILKIGIIGGIIALTSACSLTQPMYRPSSATDSSEWSANQFAEEISRLEKIIRSDTDLSRKKTAHLQLAELYISFKNPERNYKMALSQLEGYAALDPTFNTQYQIRNWLAALKEIERLSMAIFHQEKQIENLSLQIKDSSHKNSVQDKKETKLARQNDELQQINSELRKKNQALSDYTQKLEQTIEMLKNLDRRLEEKRKSFNQ